MFIGPADKRLTLFQSCGNFIESAEVKKWRALSLDRLSVRRITVAKQTYKRRLVMSTPAKSEYILLFRGTDWHKGLSPEEIQEVVKKMYAWLDRLSAEGKAKIGKPLFPEGKIVSQKKGRSIADGPFAESKEAIGGFFLLEVGSLEEAAEIAKEFPGLNYGASVEVRPVAPECPMALGESNASATQRATANA
jgi:hypothetical protein